MFLLFEKMFINTQKQTNQTLHFKVQILEAENEELGYLNI